MSTNLFHFTWFPSTQHPPDDWDYRAQLHDSFEQAYAGIDRSKWRVVAQLELCPETNRYHWQGLIHFVSTERKVNHVRILLQSAMSGCHVKPARKPLLAGYRYCTKDKTRVDGVDRYYWPEFWEPHAGQGQRSDLTSASTTLREEGWDALIDAHPSVVTKYPSGFRLLRESYERRARAHWRLVTVFVLWGVSRVGKTRFCYDYCDGNLFRLPVSGRIDHLWWDGYMGEDWLLLDDFYGNIPLTQMLNILDGHPLRLDVKGSHVYAKYSKVFITSNVPPDQWYDYSKFKNQDVVDAFKKRLTCVYHVVLPSATGFSFETFTTSDVKKELDLMLEDE